MRNCDIKIKDNIMTITVDLSVKGEVSSSGKSLVLGSTEGNVSCPDNPDIKVGLNVYIKK
jgi:hypothetical protein